MTMTRDKVHRPDGYSTSVRDATAIEVRRARRNELPALAAILADAFFDDPLFAWIYPGKAGRRRGLPEFFAAFADALAPHDEVYVAGSSDGAALWVPPGHPPVADDDVPAFERRLEATAADADAERFFEVVELIDSRHPAGSYFYLLFVGVPSARQGEGIGSAMLRHVLDLCDRDGTRAYLDATSPDNKRLYERHGFRADAPFAPVGGPPVWPMWREPDANPRR